MDNTLVLLNYNDWETCCSLISRIKNYSSIQQIVIVDNKSTDDSFENLSFRFRKTDKVKVIESDKNGGYAYGNNIGIRYAIKNYKPQFLTIANPDVFFEDNTLTQVIESFYKCENPGIITCKMNCTSNIALPIAWKLPTYWNIVFNNLILLKKLIGDKTLYDKGYFERKGLVKVDVLPGSFFVVGADVISSVGLFDENTFLYYEEAILAKKIMDKGYNNYLLLDCEYIHNHSVSINKSIRSSRDRLRIAGISGEYYCCEYLMINELQRKLYRLTLNVGINDYTVIKKIIDCFHT